MELLLLQSHLCFGLKLCFEMVALLRSLIVIGFENTEIPVNWIPISYMNILGFSNIMKKPVIPLLFSVGQIHIFPSLLFTFPLPSLSRNPLLPENQQLRSQPRLCEPPPSPTTDIPSSSFSNSHDKSYSFSTISNWWFSRFLCAQYLNQVV